MKKKNILLTGSDGRIGTFLKKKLKNKYNLINADIKNGTIINKDFLRKVFQKKIYAVILCHGKNTTPLKNKKNTKDIDLDLKENSMMNQISKQMNHKLIDLIQLIYQKMGMVHTEELQQIL